MKKLIKKLTIIFTVPLLILISLSNFSADENTKYVVIRAAANIDIRVSYNGQILSSFQDDFSLSNDIGRLDIIGSENDIMMICIDYFKGINIEIAGNNLGETDYRIQWFNGNDELLDERQFQKIPITNKTIIKTGLNKEDTTVLDIDEDSDGVINKQLRAEKDEVISPEGHAINRFELQRLANERRGNSTSASTTIIVDSSEQNNYDDSFDSEQFKTNLIIAAFILSIIIMILVIIFCLRKVKQQIKDYPKF